MCFGQLCKETVVALAHTCRLTCQDAWNKKNVCPHDDGVQSKTNFVPRIAQPIVRITRNNRRTPTKNQTACRNHQQKKTKTELKKSCTTHRTLVNATRQLSAVTPMKCSVEYRSTAQVGYIQAPHCPSRCTRVAQKTNMSFQRFDRFHHGANNKHNVCRSSNVHRRHQPTTHDDKTKTGQISRQPRKLPQRC